MHSAVGPSHPGDASHRRALVQAYDHLHDVQFDTTIPKPTFLIGEASENGWHDVVFIYAYAEMARATLRGQDFTGALDDMQAAAESSQNNALLAHYMASQADLRPGVDSEDEPEHMLARAVAMLATGVGSPITRSTAYIQCGNAYRHIELWPLFEEMNLLAAVALDVPLPAEFTRISAQNIAVTVLNRLYAALAMACEAYEVGLPDEVLSIIDAAPAYPAEAGPYVQPQMLVEYRVILDLMQALSGQPSVDSPPQQPTDTFTTICSALAEAVRILDDDPERAATLADVALDELAGDEVQVPLRSLASYIKARTPPVSLPALHYARDLARRRWEARQHNVRSARSRRRTEELVLANEELRQLAFGDALTGLANRRGYERHVDLLRNSFRNTLIGVLVLDVDDFKSVNDTHGHRVGDEVLRRLGHLLRNSVRSRDLAARTGGDEFLVILHDVPPDIAFGRAQLIAAAVESTVWSDLSPGLTVSITVGHTCGLPGDFNELVDRADRSMYELKQRRQWDNPEAFSVEDGDLRPGGPAWPPT